MAGMDEKRPPFAAITDTNRGPLNTIFCICLVVTSILIAVVRYFISRKKVISVELDDWLAISSSLLSQSMVRSGLGQHIDSVPAAEIDEFFKKHYCTLLMNVLSMYCSKASIIFMFHRIISSAGRGTKKVLLPIVMSCGFVSLALIAFQCQLPKPWVLIPLSCSTSARVHYATTASNIATDVLVAVWITPDIWRLNMPRSRRLVVVSLFLSRLIVCAAEFAKLQHLIRALGSTDSTWDFLDWAIMDQLVVHVSLNHATLPRINAFLRNLQTGATVSRLQAHSGKAARTYGQSSRPMNSSNHDAKRSGFPRVTSYRNNSATSSEEHLQLDHGNEMLTMVVANEAVSTSSADNPGPYGGIKVEQTVEILRR
ncbi:hypothetical protein M011DRAFT_490828 [Sporormia fimetaria CBS 119925]|uniref:Rhodopsin domain-containing protein n=1 Tax=Sporormia fimetaria CBS 119925 TaxID=1340428 RepID=A0A6A6UUY5_9PLEO|nr:hypothetical protein M011DRAFT_490828 [Sporormia fimetaria CBS 119925]